MKAILSILKDLKKNINMIRRDKEESNGILELKIQYLKYQKKKKKSLDWLNNRLDTAKEKSVNSKITVIKTV